MYLAGQKKNLDLIKNWNNMPSFLIVQGNNDTGKTYFIKYLCDRFGLGYILLDNKVDTVRHLVDSVNPETHTVYHFQDFHKASINAKNALLKITEEPLKGNYIAISGLKQIDTLESRARIIKMQPYTEEDLLEFIDNSSINENTAKKLIGCNFRTPSLLLKYGSVEGIDDLISYAEFVATDIVSLNQSDINNIVNRFDRSYDKGSVDLSLVFIEILCNILERQMLQKKYLCFSKEFKKLFEAKHLLSQGTNYNRKLLLQSTFESLVFKE